MTVSFAGQKKETTVGTNGDWMVKLGKLKASATPSTLTVLGNNEIKLQNVLVGEVWLCSGQSNMEWHVRQCANPNEEIAAANYPNIRLFDVPGHTIHPQPQRKGQGNWNVCSPASVPKFSAAGYYFGRRLHIELDIPVGLIGANWGGTRIEPWTTLDGFTSVPELSAQAKEVAAYNPKTKVNPQKPSAIYNSMVHPLTPYALRGAIWYQGESNGKEGISYYHKKHALVNGWRQAFPKPQPWLLLGSACATSKQPGTTPGGGDGWAKLREAQTRALDLSHSGHGRHHRPRRCSQAPATFTPRTSRMSGAGWLSMDALHQTYGKKKTSSHPARFTPSHQDQREIKCILSFNHTGQGSHGG